MKRALRGCVAVLTFLAAPLAAADETDATPPDAAPSEVEFSLRGSAFYGPISGSLQVPLGGNPGTTSGKRPTLHELGIDDAAFWDVTARVQWGAVGVFGGYTGLDLSSSGTLSESLVSHGVAFAAGSPFKNSTQLNVGNLGAGWRFDFDQRRLELDGVASLPISHMPQLSGVTGRLAYHLFPTSPVHATLFLGCAGRWIDFEDSQTVPNHISVRSGPLLTGGFTVSF